MTQQPTLDDLTEHDRKEVEGFQFYLSVAGKPDERNAPYRDLARAWYNGLLTTDEGKRIVEGRQVWQ